MNATLALPDEEFVAAFEAAALPDGFPHRAHVRLAWLYVCRFGPPEAAERVVDGIRRLAQAEAHVLAHLAESGPSTVGQLHRAFGHRRSTLTSVLDRLEGRGHVRRELNPADRRTFTIVPTVSGKKAGRRARAALAQIES